MLPGVSGQQKPPRSSHLQINNCSYFCKCPNHHCAKNSKVGQADLKTTCLEKWHSFFDPKIEAVQSKQQGITFDAVVFVVFNFILKYGNCQQGCARVYPPYPVAVGADGCTMVWPPLFGDWSRVLCCPCSRWGAGLGREGYGQRQHPALLHKCLMRQQAP